MDRDSLVLLAAAIVVVVVLIAGQIWKQSPKVEFLIDGIAYYTKKTCIRHETITQMIPTYYPGTSGRPGATRLTPYTRMHCLEYRIDTLKLETHAEIE